MKLYKSFIIFLITLLVLTTTAQSKEDLTGFEAEIKDIKSGETPMILYVVRNNATEQKDMSINIEYSINNSLVGTHNQEYTVPSGEEAINGGNMAFRVAEGENSFNIEVTSNDEIIYQNSESFNVDSNTNKSFSYAIGFKGTETSFKVVERRPSILKRIINVFDGIVEKINDLI